MGSVLYENVGYSGTMYAFGILTVANLVLCKYMMPEVLNLKVAEVKQPLTP